MHAQSDPRELLHRSVALIHFSIDSINSINYLKCSLTFAYFLDRRTQRRNNSLPEYESINN